MYSYSQKSTEDLSLMTLNSDARFNERLTCVFKYDMRNFFSMSSSCPSITLFVQGLSYKNTEDLSFMTLNSDAENE